MELSEQQLSKVTQIFTEFDANGDGALSKDEMAHLVVAVNPTVQFQEEQIEAILDEVFRQYGDYITDKGLTLDGLTKTYRDQAGDVDRDFEALSLELAPPEQEAEPEEQSSPPKLPEGEDALAKDGAVSSAIGAPLHTSPPKQPEPMPEVPEMQKGLSPSGNQDATLSAEASTIVMTLSDAIANNGKGVEKVAKDLRRETDALPDTGDAFECHMEMGFQLAQGQHYDEALLSFKKAQKLQPNSARAEFRVGNTLFAKGQLTKSTEHFQQALRVAHSSKDAALLPKIHVNLGITLEAMGMLINACEHYREAAILNPSHARALKLLGSALYALGELRAAEEALQHALHLDNGYADAHCDLGCTLSALDESERAAGSFERAIALEPTHLEAHFNLGNLHRTTGRFADAISAYTEVLSINSNSWRALLNRAVAHIAIGASAKAQEDLQEAFHKSDKRIELYDEIKQLKKISKSEAANKLLQAASPIEHSSSGRTNLGTAKGYQATRLRGLLAKRDIKAIEAHGHKLEQLHEVVDTAMLAQLTPFSKCKITALREEANAANLATAVGGGIRKNIAEQILRNMLKDLSPVAFQCVLRTVNKHIFSVLDTGKTGIVDLGMLLAVAMMLVDTELNIRKEGAWDMLCWQAEAQNAPRGLALRFAGSLRVIFAADEEHKGVVTVVADDTEISYQEFSTMLDDPGSGFPYLAALPKLTSRHGWAM